MLITASVGIFCNIILICVLGADHHAPAGGAHTCHGHSHNLNEDSKNDNHSNKCHGHSHNQNKNHFHNKDNHDSENNECHEHSHNSNHNNCDLNTKNDEYHSHKLNDTHGHSHNKNDHDSTAESDKILVNSDLKKDSICESIKNDINITDINEINNKEIINTNTTIISNEKNSNQDTRPINIKASIIHVCGDLVQSIGVLIAAIIIMIEPS